MALEYLEGQDLSQRIKDGPSLQESLRICLAVAEAVNEHIDTVSCIVILSLPTCSFRGMGECALDFGWPSNLPTRSTASARVTITIDEKAPQPRVVGTPAYMAPEQWRGHECQPATDVGIGIDSPRTYRWGTPLRRTCPSPTGLSVCSTDPVPIHSALDGLPPRVSGLIKQCLAKTPEDRPTITTFIETLSSALADGRRVAPVEESPFEAFCPFQNAMQASSLVETPS